MGPKWEKIYFLENLVLNLIELRLKYLPKTIGVYKEAIKKDSIYMGEKTLSRDIAENETLEQLFKQRWEDDAITLELNNEWHWFW